MKRGEIWTVARGPDDAGKPRPAMIVQDDAFDATASVTVCPFATHELDAPLMRLAVAPSTSNGLTGESFLMVDKVTTVSRETLGQCAGRLAPADLARFDRAMLVFLGLANRT